MTSLKTNLEGKLPCCLRANGYLNNDEHFMMQSKGILICINAIKWFLRDGMWCKQLNMWVVSMCLFPKHKSTRSLKLFYDVFVILHFSTKTLPLIYPELMLGKAAYLNKIVIMLPLHQRESSVSVAFIFFVRCKK